jgi:TRAP-type C4-dicarboxylate transport system substrate-binding protein
MKSMSWKALAAAAFIVGGTAMPALAQVNLLLTTMSPPGEDFSTKFFRPWAERMTAASNGAINVDPRDGFAIAGFGNVYDRVLSDVVQIGWGMQGGIGGKFPLTEVATFPFQADTAEQASVALWRLYQSGALADEYANIKPLILGTYPMNGVHYAKKPKSLDDFSGLKLRTASKPQSDWIEHLGGAPISMPMEDVYTGLERGTIDATLQAWSAFGPVKLADVTNFHVNVALGTSTIMIFMSKQKYDSLPAAGRKAIDDNSGEAMSRAWGKFCDDIAQGLRQQVLALPGQTEARLTAAQEASWTRRVQPVTDAWIAAHPGGDKLVQHYRSLLADVKAGK